tara:strand:- start:1946 stop:3235 length:1290 start_codon:yes stop_codon:yes gene_type:complete
MKNDPKKTGIVHLWNLPEKETYLDLVEPFRIEFLNKARYVAGGKWNDLARKLYLPISKKDNSCGVIRSFRRKHPTSLGLINKISNFLIDNGYSRFSLENIEKNIASLGVKSSKYRLKNPKLPFDFNTKYGASIISSMYCDGGILVRDTEPFYSNTSSELKVRFIKSINYVFGDIHYWERPKEINLPKFYGLVLITLGLVPGRRPINNPKFPDFVFNYPDDLVFEFLGQAIADDGWVHCPPEGYGFIGFNFTIDLTRLSEEARQKVRRDKIFRYIPNVLLGVKELFERVGVKVEGVYLGNQKRYYKNGKERRYTQEWRIYIRDWRSINFLANKLDISLKYKQERLERIAKRERDVVRCNPKLLRMIGGLDNSFFANELIKESGFDNRTVRYQLNCFCEDGFLRKERFNVGRTKFRYSLTDKGREEMNYIS